MTFLRKHQSNSNPRFPAFRGDKRNRDAQRVTVELAAIRAHNCS
jgi:hypothetical protein